MYASNLSTCIHVQIVSTLDRTKWYYVKRMLRVLVDKHEQHGQLAHARQHTLPSKDTNEGVKPVSPAFSVSSPGINMPVEAASPLPASSRPIWARACCVRAFSPPSNGCTYENPDLYCSVFVWVVLRVVGSSVW